MIIQITAFKAILARRIHIRRCEDYKKDYKNTFARIESDCALRFDFKVLIKSIWNALAGPEALSRACSCCVWQCSRVSTCITQVTWKTINNTLLIYNWWLCFLHI